ncbi:MAG: hypothetical protein L0G32_05370 [Pediococcus sp.]|nr:hypothetical protein [Pediococcus sp.]
MMKKALVLVSDAVSIKNPYLIKTIKKLVNNQIRVTVLVMILDYHLAAKVTFKLTKAVARENSEAKIINWFDLLHEQKGIAVSLQTLDTIHSGEPENGLLNFLNMKRSKGILINMTSSWNGFLDKTDWRFLKALRMVRYKRNTIMMTNKEFEKLSIFKMDSQQFMKF